MRTTAIRLTDDQITALAVVLHAVTLDLAVGEFDHRLATPDYYDGAQKITTAARDLAHGSTKRASQAGEAAFESSTAAHLEDVAATYPEAFTGLGIRSAGLCYEHDVRDCAECIAWAIADRRKSL